MRQEIGKYVVTLDQVPNPQRPIVVRMEQLTPKARYSHSKLLAYKSYCDLQAARSYYLMLIKLAEDRIESRKKRLAQRKQRNAYVDASLHYSIGDIVVNTWGYEQTNVEFYQVIELKPKSIVVKQIAMELVKATGPDSETVKAVPNKFVEHQSRYLYTLRVKNQGRLSQPESYYHFRKWDRRPQHRSWGY